MVAAYKGGSTDMPESANRVEGFAKEIHTKYGVEIVPDIATLLSKVDAVLIESVDARPHLAQARPVIAAHKPFFIDKPLARHAGGCARDRAPGESGGRAVVQLVEHALRRDRRRQDGPGITGVTTWGPGPFEDAP